jgi:replicative DNA helicase
MTKKVVYSFEAEFQTKIAALVVRDADFNRRTSGLIRPDYFENAAEATLVDIGVDFYERYGRVPDNASLINILKSKIAKRLIRADLVPEIKDKIIELQKTNIADGPYVVECVAEFAKHRAMENAIIESVKFLEKGDFQKIEKLIQHANTVGAGEMLQEYEYFEEIENRTQYRKDVVAGKIAPQGITTGIPELDRCLKHKGWGRRELSMIMGAAKKGKSAGLAFFARNAALAGYNALLISLEVSTEIISERVDASIAEVPMMEIPTRIVDTELRVRSAVKARKPGKFYIEEYPSGTLKCSGLRRILERYKAKGTKFDLIVPDYGGIMAPEVYTTDKIENSRQIHLGLRAIAQEEDAAMLSAAQTNRSGAKATVADDTDVAEDFNIIRIADLTISINSTEEERARNEARLFFASSRNQQGKFSLKVTQDMQTMRFVTKVLGRE